MALTHFEFRCSSPTILLLMLKRWRGFPLQLFALIILPLTILLVGITFGSLALHQRAMRTLVGERDERAVRGAAAAISEQLNHKAATVHSLLLQAAATGDPEQTLADADSFLHDFEGGLAFFDADGTLLASTNNADLWQEPQVSQALAEPSMGNDLSNHAQFVTTFTDPTLGEDFMLVATEMPDGLTVMGAFSPANMSRQVLTDIFDTSDRASAYLVDAQDQLLYHLGAEPRKGIDLAQYPGVQEALRGDRGTTYVAVEGDEHVIAFSPIAPVNWALVFEEPWRTVADPILRTTELTPLILVPVLIVALVGLWFGVRQIVQPLQSLEQKATKLAWGDFEAIEEPVGGINEIQRLQTELVHMAQKVKAAQQSLRGYLGAITTGQEEERRRLARELHDDTIQSLIALNQREQLAQMALEGHPALDQVTEMQSMTTQMIADLRRLTRDLRPIYLEDLGLVPALDMLARDTGVALGIPVKLETSGPERRLRPEVELAFFRLVQEALSNVTRHAQATHAVVGLDFGLKEISLLVDDDGCGFIVPETPAEMAAEGHFGLLGMQERAELIDARLTVNSTPGQGTSVSFVLAI
jgi:signal transduction histidine kinase